MPNHLMDHTGETFGRWIVLRRDTSVKGPARWICRCSCGKEKSVRGCDLRSGTSRSCRCIGGDRFRIISQFLRGDNNSSRKAALKRHGSILDVKDKWYRRASGISARCKREKVPFGFKSINECALYLKSIAPTHCPIFGFEFEDGDAGFCPKAPSADRIKPNLGYVAGNIQIISFKANSMKANASQEDLVAFAKWVLTREDTP